MSQPLKIETIHLDRANVGGLLESLTLQAKKSDLIVCPLMAVATLSQADLVVPLTDDEVRSSEQQLGRLFPTVKAAARFAGQNVAMPIGARVPALLTVDEVGKLESWEDYDRWVGELDGEASEPLSAGWAGTMFLWRAASTVEQGWLFSRDDMRPIIDSESYVDVLSLMSKTASRYKGGRQSPAQIWKQLQSGKLRGAVGFEVAVDDEGVDIAASNAPGILGVNKVLLDPFSPVVSLSSSCRQSSAAKALLQWLSGGDGSESVRRQLDGMTLTRSQLPSASANYRSRSGSSYSRWLRERLATPVHVPPLQLLAGDQYYAVLDQKIGNCLDGELEPAAALGAVAQAWHAVTERVGADQQQRTWRRAEGMKA